MTSARAKGRELDTQCHIVSSADPSLGWAVDSNGSLKIDRKRSKFTLKRSKGRGGEGVNISSHDPRNPDARFYVDTCMPATRDSVMKMRLAPCSDHRNQRFRFEPTGDGSSYRIYPVSTTDETLVVDMCDKASPRLTFCPHTNTSSQVWIIAPIGTLQHLSKRKPDCSAPSDVSTRAELLRGVYRKGAAFPSWALKCYQKNYCKYSPSVKVYYDENSNVEVVKSLVTMREPVNIEMKRLYDEGKMERYFGWKTGYYGTHYSLHGSPAPNVAIYCLTPVQTGDNSFLDAHILNATGLAFDSPDQPDYKYYIRDGRQTQVPLVYERLFTKIFVCAKEMGLDHVVMSLVGANNFAKLYRDTGGKGPAYFQETVWVPVLKRVMKRFRQCTVSLMGGSQSRAQQLMVKVPNLGDFPRCVRNVAHTKTLFVNAWDPWSIVGNGNAMDNSLDGYMGRCTMMGLLCWPPTNPNITFGFT